MSQYSLLSIPPYQFILPLASLREVLPHTKVHTIPGTAAHIKGVIPIRGELCVVLCIPSLLHFEAQKTTTQQLVIIDHHLGLFAIEATRVDIFSSSYPILPVLEGIPFQEWTTGMIHDPTMGALFLLDFTPLETLV